MKRLMLLLVIVVPFAATAFSDNISESLYGIPVSFHSGR